MIRLFLAQIHGFLFFCDRFNDNRQELCHLSTIIAKKTGGGQRCNVIGKGLTVFLDRLSLGMSHSLFLIKNPIFPV